MSEITTLLQQRTPSESSQIWISNESLNDLKPKLINKRKSQQANYYLSQEETQSNKNLLRNIKIEQKKVRITNCRTTPIALIIKTIEQGEREKKSQSPNELNDDSNCRDPAE